MGWWAAPALFRSRGIHVFERWFGSRESPTPIFPGCPHADEARKVLRAALRACALMDVAVEEVDVEAATTPPELRGWGSPTILVNGADVGGEKGPSGLSCRVYPGGEPSGVPPQRLIERSVRNALSTGTR